MYKEEGTVHVCVCHMCVGLAQEALSDAQKSRALDSKYVKAWYREAQAYEMLKDW